MKKTTALAVAILLVTVVFLCGCTEEEVIGADNDKIVSWFYDTRAENTEYTGEIVELIEEAKIYTLQIKILSYRAYLEDVIKTLKSFSLTGEEDLLRDDLQNYFELSLEWTVTMHNYYDYIIAGYIEAAMEYLDLADQLDAESGPFINSALERIKKIEGT